MDMDKAMAPVAEALGIDADELKTKLEGGATLDDIATESGVSHDDLVSAIKQGLSDAAPAGRTETVDLTRMAEDIASGVRPSGGPAGPPPPPRPGVQGAGEDGLKQSLSRVAELLDVGTDELTEQLQSGSLVDLAKSKNVDASTLLSAFGRQVDGYA
jgi:hypothetical protein